MKFCTVCGEWFDPANAVLHCARPKAAPLPTPPPALPYGDFGTVWPISERREHPSHNYSGDLPTDAGYYVYRLWEPGWWGNENGCLYVGMVGENGPRLLGARLNEHRRTKSWWWRVKRIDAAVSTLHDVGHEEALQIARLHPERNRRTEGRRLTAAEADAAQGWDERLFG